MTAATDLPTSDRSLWTARNDLRRTRWAERPVRTPSPGEALLRIDCLALTANNVTYGAFGDGMHYWDFFPTDDPEWGRIPAWGFATVVASAADGVPVGARVYGYFPIGRWLTVSPTRVGDSGFSDGAAHRQPLHAVYNRYLRCDHDPQYRPDHEHLIAVLRPLFTTSVLIDDFLADEGFFSASQVVLSSASSKTAWAAARCLRRRPGMAVVGLTSARNRAFVQRLDLYDRVIVYDDVPSLERAPTVYVDFAGSGDLRRAVHTHLGERLAYSCAVGATDWSHAGSGRGAPLPGPRPQLFFAPARIAKRGSDWGREGLAQRLDAAWRDFADAVAASTPPWLRIELARGDDAIGAAYARVVDGREPADTAVVLAPGD